MCSRIDYAILKKNPPTADDVVPLVKGTRLILAPIETEGFAECGDAEWEYLPTEFEVATTDDEELTGYMITYDENDEPIRTYGEVNLGHTPILFFGTLEDFQCSPMEYPFDEDIATGIITEMEQEIRRLKESVCILHVKHWEHHFGNKRLRESYATEMNKCHKLRDNLNIAVDMMDEDTQAEYHKYIKYLEDEDKEDH